MDYLTVAQNQHFVSQAEQRLNASNPQAKRENQRINAFLVEGSDQRTYRLETPDGLKISKNLSFRDLFSFDIVSSSHRHALEEKFHQYESDITTHTLELLRKLSTSETDIKREVVELFASKLLNFLRNPHSIKKVLNTFGSAADYSPSDSTLRRDYERVLVGSRPHQEHVCRVFELTAGEYERWLRCLFILLSPGDATGHTHFDHTIKAMFEGSYVIVRVHRYTSTLSEHVCLLSDRGFTICSEAPSILCFDFNLTARAFVQFAFADIAAHVPPGIPQAVVDILKERREVQLFHTVNDLDALAHYNANTLHQCNRRVFCAATQFLTAP